MKPLQASRGTVALSHSQALTTPTTQASSSGTSVRNLLHLHSFYPNSKLESRTNAANAPTTIYMPGGPGSSFLADGSGLPCRVNPDGQSTSLNPWSWNNEVNMLFIDIPVQTGFSYTNIESGTFDFFTRKFSTLSKGTQTNLTTVKATMSSQSPADTLNTTQQIVRQMWQISQVWFQEYDNQLSRR